ncbi:helix-turn-helix domain-containing protein [Roseburia inulinivorans]
MSTYEVIKQLCDEHGIALTALEKELGFGRGSLGKLKSGGTSAKRLQKIADYFGVSINYLMNGETTEKINNTSQLSTKDERDIAKDMENIRQKLMNGADGPLSYDGEPVTAEDAELLLGQIELMMRRLKPIHKEKYNPNKNKK